MLRSLYRVYLYGIIILLLYFTAISTTAFLATLLGMTPLNGAIESEPASSAIVQSAVFTIIAWIITLGVGGFHYWLLRRDEIADPAAANGTVRAFLVNLGEGIAALTALIGGVVALTIVSNGSSASTAFATLFVFAALFVLFEGERRRRSAVSGAALVFQRLHFALLQLIFLLFFVLPALFDVLTQSFYAVLNNLGILNETCYYNFIGVGYCNESQTASTTSNQFVPAWLLVGLVLLAWLGYWLLAREENHSKLIETFRFLGFATGVIVLLVALNRALELVVRLVGGVQTTGLDFALSYNFVTPLLIGLLVAGVYALWLRSDAMRARQPLHLTRLIALAIAAGLAAITFWMGCMALLDDLTGQLVSTGSSSSPSMFISNLALMLTGVVYIPLELWLSASTRRADASAAPRRAFMFALLALGVLDAVISLIVLLYALLTAALGNPTGEWQQTARTAGDALIVGALIAAIYGWRLLAEQRRQSVSSGASQPAHSPAVAPAMTPVVDLDAVTLPGAIPAPSAAGASLSASPAITIEGVLDDLLAGRMTRDQAAARIRALASA